jgi:hypothetical protein
MAMDYRSIWFWSQYGGSGSILAKGACEQMLLAAVTRANYGHIQDEQFNLMS